jgi:hypothetical protein
MTLSLSESQTITLLDIIKKKISIIKEKHESTVDINLNAYSNFMSLATNNTDVYDPSVSINSDFIDNFTTDEFNAILTAIEKEIKDNSESIDKSYLLHIQGLRSYWFSMFTYM